MQPSDQLFRLIKSLDPSEKGYFKKFARSYGKAQNYLLLFDAIDAQEVYDEQWLIQKFKKQPFVRQFSVAKHHLWELVLRALRQYRSEHSKFVRLNTLLENGEILFEKGMYEESMRSWDKAAKLAEEYDEKPFQLDIETARRRYYIDMTAGHWAEFTTPSFTRSRQLLSAYGRTLDIQEKYVHIIHCIKSQPYFRTEEQKREWQAFMDDPLLHPDHVPEDFYGKLYFYYIHNIYHLLCRDKEQALPWIRKVVELWEQNTELRDLEPVKYISAVNNYLTNLLFLGETEAYCAFFEAFTPPQTRSIATGAILFEHIWLMRSNYFHLRKDLDGLGRFIEETAHEVEQLAPYFNKVRLMIIRFTMASHYTMHGKPEYSNQLLEQIVDSREVALRKDLQSLARVLQMINHYSVGNLLLMEHLIRSAKHFMQKNDMYYDTEKLIFRHFGQLIRSPDSVTKRQVLADMRDDIAQLFETNETERTAFETMYLLEWIDNQLQA